MALNPAENTPLTLQAEAPKQPEAKKPDYKRVDDASIANLQLAEKALKDSIDASGLEAAITASLKKRITDDSDLVQNSSIQQLNDAEKTVPLDDSKSIGLADRQNKTKKIIEDAVAKLDAAKQHDISKKLTAIHDMRRTLLDDTLNQEDQEVLDRAYQMFNNMLNRNPEAAVMARLTGGTAQSSLKAELEKMSQPTIETERGKIHFTKNGTHAESSSPEILGVGMVAAGHKKITFTAKHPENALRAAEAALNAGAEDFKFDGNTMRLLQEPNQPYYLNSAVEHKRLNDWYDRLRKRVEANQHAKANSANRVFNKDVSKSQEHSLAFGQHGTPEAHRDFLTSLSPDDQAKLAMTLLDRDKANDTKTTYRLDGKALDPGQYIHRLLSDEYNKDKKTSNPPFIKREDPFIRSFAKLEIDNLSKVKNEALSTEAFANLRTTEARTKFYERINALSEDKPEDANKRNKLRAACLGALIDKGYKKLADAPEHSASTASKVAKKTSEQINKLLDGVAPQDKTMTLAIFQEYFHRAQAIIENYDGPKITEITDATHLPADAYTAKNKNRPPEKGKDLFEDIDDTFVEGKNAERLIKDDKSLVLYQKLVESSVESLREFAPPAPGRPARVIRSSADPKAAPAEQSAIPEVAPLPAGPSWFRTKLGEGYDYLRSRFQSTAKQDSDVINPKAGEKKEVESPVSHALNPNLRLSLLEEVDQQKPVSQAPQKTTEEKNKEEEEDDSPNLTP